MMPPTMRGLDVFPLERITWLFVSHHGPGEDAGDIRDSECADG